MKTKTIWLLDVDGVINCNGPWGQVREHSARDQHGQDWPMIWSRSVTEFIRDVIDKKYAEVVWCTTWCPAASSLEKLWGFPRLRRAWADNPRSKFVGDRKLDAARKVLADGHRLIWTDDTETPSLDGSRLDQLTYNALKAAGTSLLIRPDEHAGLQLSDLGKITAFLSRGRSEQAS